MFLSSSRNHRMRKGGGERYELRRDDAVVGSPPGVENPGGGGGGFRLFPGRSKDAKKGGGGSKEDEEAAKAIADFGTYYGSTSELIKNDVSFTHLEIFLVDFGVFLHRIKLCSKKFGPFIQGAGFGPVGGKKGRKGGCAGSFLRPGGRKGRRQLGRESTNWLPSLPFHLLP